MKIQIIAHHLKRKDHLTFKKLVKSHPKDDIHHQKAITNLLPLCQSANHTPNPLRFLLKIASLPFFLQTCSLFLLTLFDTIILKNFQGCKLATLTLNDLLKQFERELVMPPWTITHFFVPMISWRDI